MRRRDFISHFGGAAAAVRDIGPGLVAADEVTIFEEFQQGDTSATKKKGGTELGLSIAKRIVLMSDGHLWVESDLGKGSTFWFMIPVTEERQVAS